MMNALKNGFWLAFAIMAVVPSRLGIADISFLVRARHMDGYGILPDN